MKTLSALSLVLILVTFTNAAVAQEIVCPKSSTNADKNKNEARRYYAMGITFFKMQKYKKSVASFNCVISLVPYSSNARFRLALSYKHLKQYKKALEHFKWVMVDVSREAKTIKERAKKHAQEIETLLRAKAKKEREKLEAARKAAALQKKKAETARKRAAAQKAAALKRAKAKQREAVAKQREAQAALSRTKGKAKAHSSKSLAPRHNTSLSSRWWFWTGIGATAIFTAATIGLGLKTMSLRDDYETDYNESAKKDLITFRTITDLALGAAIVSGALLLYGILTHDSAPSKQEPMKTAIIPLCTGSSCGVSFTFDF